MDTLRLLVMAALILSAFTTLTEAGDSQFSLRSSDVDSKDAYDREDYERDRESKDWDEYKKDKKDDRKKDDRDCDKDKEEDDSDREEDDSSDETE